MCPASETENGMKLRTHRAQNCPSPLDNGGSGKESNLASVSYSKSEAKWAPDRSIKSGARASQSDVAPRPVVGPLATLGTTLKKINFSLWKISNTHKSRDQSTMTPQVPPTQIQQSSTLCQPIAFKLTPNFFLKFLEQIPVHPEILHIYEDF